MSDPAATPSRRHRVASLEDLLRETTVRVGENSHVATQRLLSCPPDPAGYRLPASRTDSGHTPGLRSSTRCQPRTGVSALLWANDTTGRDKAHRARPASVGLVVDERLLGLAVLRAYHHAAAVPSGRLEAAYVRPAFQAGQAMALAERMRAQGQRLTGPRVNDLASFLGISRFDLTRVVLPTLKAAGVVDFTVQNEALVAVEEYVGVASPFLQQTAKVFELFDPRPADRAVVLSGQLAAHSPMVERNHIDALLRADLAERDAREGLKAAAAIQLVRRIRSRELNDTIIYNEHVWSTGAVEISAFLRSLPSLERDVLLGIVNTAASSPGIALRGLEASTSAAPVVTAARKVGLVDTVQVRSRTGANQTYAFSPLLERDLAVRKSTDALHERKLFVAHILFGHQFGRPSTGRIQDPVVLVDSLIRKGSVGPATAISNDYLLLESFGILRTVPAWGSTSYLEIVKEDVVRDGQQLLTQTLGASSSMSTPGDMDGLWLPGSFRGPEHDRRLLDEPSAEAAELFEGVVRRLHDEAARTTRGEDF